MAKTANYQKQIKLHCRTFSSWSQGLTIYLYRTEIQEIIFASYNPAIHPTKLLQNVVCQLTCTVSQQSQIILY